MQLSIIAIYVGSNLAREKLRQCRIKNNNNNKKTFTEVNGVCIISFNNLWEFV